MARGGLKTTICQFAVSSTITQNLTFVAKLVLLIIVPITSVSLAVESTPIPGYVVDGNNRKPLLDWHTTNDAWKVTQEKITAVSYTHLTLPTILLV